MIRGVNKLMAKKDETPAAPPRNEVLLEEIRDILAKKDGLSA